MATRITFINGEGDGENDDGGGAGKELRPARAAQLLPAGEQRARDARMVELHAKGYSERDIATEFGLSVSSVHKALQRTWAMVMDPHVSVIRRRADLEIQLMRKELWRLAMKTSFAHAANGRIILDPLTGDPMIDTNPQVLALRELRDLNESWRKLHGADAPRKSISAQIPESEMLRELEELRKVTNVDSALDDPRIQALIEGIVISSENDNDSNAAG